MSSAADALRKAVEYEKKALENYQEALAQTKFQETRETLEKIAKERTHEIDSLSWMIMAEAGELEAESTPEDTKTETEAEAKPASKCPFSGALAEMGIDISKMGDMADGDFSKMKDMAKMMGMESPDSPDSKNDKKDS